MSDNSVEKHIGNRHRERSKKYAIRVSIIAFIGFLFGMLLMWPIYYLSTAQYISYNDVIKVALSVIFVADSSFYQWLYDTYISIYFFKEPFLPILMPFILATVPSVIYWHKTGPHDFTYRHKGMAKFGDKRFIRDELDMLNKPQGLLVGNFTGSEEDGRSNPIKHNNPAGWLRIFKPLSAYLISPPGTGKTVKLIGNLLATNLYSPRYAKKILAKSQKCAANMLKIPSRIIYDPKGEISKLTAAFLSLFGPVFVINWESEHGACWNPLSFKNIKGCDSLIEKRRGLINYICENTSLQRNEAAQLLTYMIKQSRYSSFSKRMEDALKNIASLSLDGNKKSEEIIQEIDKSKKKIADDLKEHLKNYISDKFEKDDDIPTNIKDAYVFSFLNEEFIKTLQEIVQAYAAQEIYVDRLQTVLIEEDMEPHWKNNGRAAGAGLMLYIMAQYEYEMVNATEDQQRTIPEPSLSGLLELVGNFGLDENENLTNNIYQSIIGGASEEAEKLRAHNKELVNKQLQMVKEEMQTPEFKDEAKKAELAIDNPPSRSSKIAANKNEKDKKPSDDPVRDALLELCIRGEERGYSARAILELRTLAGKPDKERGSIISTAVGKMSIFKQSRLAQTTSQSDITFSQIRSWGKEFDEDLPVTIYFKIPAESGPQYAVPTSMFIEGAAAYLISQPEEVARSRLVEFLLDEVSQLRPMEALKLIPALGRGVWVRELLIGQSKSQITELLKDTGEKILQGAIAFDMTYTLNDAETAKAYSENVGNQTVKKDETTKDTIFGVSTSFKRSTRVSYEGEPLVPVEFLKNMELIDPVNDKCGEFLLCAQGARSTPIFGRPIHWFREKTLKNRNVEAMKNFQMHADEFAMRRYSTSERF